jgi:hypothetical protein
MMHPHAALLAQAQLAARPPMANAAQQQAQRAAAAAAGLEAQRKLAGKKRKAQEKATSEKVGLLLVSRWTWPRPSTVLQVVDKACHNCSNQFSGFSCPRGFVCSCSPASPHVGLLTFYQF